MGIADWNFSLLMGIVFLGNPEKEKSLGLGIVFLTWVHVELKQL